MLMLAVERKGRGSKLPCQSKTGVEEEEYLFFNRDKKECPSEAGKTYTWYMPTRSCREEKSFGLENSTCAAAAAAARHAASPRHHPHNGESTKPNKVNNTTTGYVIHVMLPHVPESSRRNSVGV